MTPNRRIFWNVVATYGRSLYSLACGLFTARWVLMTLGEVDYGLIGVVGGLVGFMSFFNSLMATAVSRFYAFAVGQAQIAKNKNQSLDECRRWFNTAVAIHTILPVMLLMIGYPVGEWAVRNFLTIPPERIEACVWVFRLTALTCFVSMVSVPYHAMYTAKQEIAELTLYGFATTTIRVLFLCYMVSHQADWFVRYAAFTAFLSVVPSLIITTRSFVKYQECRFVPRYFFDWRRIREMVLYAGCRFLSSAAMMSAFQGMTILVNKVLGPTRNAAMAVSENVCSNTLSLKGAIRSAMTPAITNAMGAGDLRRVENLACRTSVCSALGVAFFALPLCLEVNEVLTLWLKNPPAHTGGLCLLMLTASFIDQLTCGQCLSVFALRNIGKFQLFEAFFFFIPLPVSWFLFKLGGDVWCVGIGFIVLYGLDNFMKLYFSRVLCAQSFRRWVRDVFVPIAIVVIVSLCVGLVPKLLLPASFGRLILTSITVELVFVPLIWFKVLTDVERNGIQARFFRLLNCRGMR